MKKKSLVVIGMMLLIVTIFTTVTFAGQSNTCDQPLLTYEKIQEIVDDWFIAKAGSPVNFKESIAGSIAENFQAAARGGENVDILGKLLLVLVQETILYETFTDEIGCSIDPTERKKLTMARDAIRMAFGEKARGVIRKLSTLTGTEEAKRQYTNYKNCYFQDIEPTFIKMYRQHPKRETCR